MKAFLQWLFFGNYFLALCAIGLCMETNCLLHVPMSKLLLLLSFLATVFYYNMAYITEKPPEEMNERSRWYFAHHATLVRLQWLMGAGMVLSVFFFLKSFGRNLLSQNLSVLTAALSFPTAALLYYGVHPRAFSFFKFREIGWLKPFLIGFSWSGMVTIFPLIFSCVERKISFQWSQEILLLFLVNLLLCSIIAILFDIKDYTTDYNLQLKTFIVKKGLSHTIRFVLLPLCFSEMLLAIFFARMQSFSLMPTSLFLFPSAMMMFVFSFLKKERNLFFYLIIIDGLALMKALCGLLAFSML
jgi:hypothetical protein